MIFVVALAVCGCVFEDLPDPRTMTEFACQQEIKRLNVELAAFRDDEDAAWLAAWSRRFAVCRRCSKLTDAPANADELERRAGKLGAHGEKHLFELAWSRALATTAKSSNPDASTAVAKFATAVAERGLTKGEAVADLELSRARVAVWRGDTVAASAAYRKAVDAYRAADAVGTRQYLNALVGATRGLIAGDPKAAVDLLEDGMDASETILKDVPDERASFQRMMLEKAGPACMTARRYAHAEFCIDRLVPLLEKTDGNLKRRQHATAQLLNMRGIAQHELGDNGRAVESYVTAIVLFFQAKGAKHDVKVAMTTNNLGNSLRDMGRLEESEKAYRESYELMAKAEPLSSRAAMVAGNLARALIRLGRADEALEAIERSETIARRGKFRPHPLLPLDRGELALLAGDFDEVRKQLEAYKAAPATHSRSTVSRDEAPLLAGRCAQLDGDAAAALKAYSERYEYQIERARRTAESLVDVRLLEFANRPEAPAPVYLLSVLEPGRAADDVRAYEAVWQARGVAAAVQMQRRRSSGDKLDGLLKALNDKRQWLSTAVNSPFLDLATAKRIPREAARLETLEERWALAAAESHPIVWRTPRDLAKRLPTGVALVEYLRVKLPRPPKSKKGRWESDDVYEAYVVRTDAAGKLAVVRKALGSAAEIDAAAVAFRNECCPMFPIGGRGRPRVANPGQTLKRLTVEPLAAALQGASVVVVAPDGMLHQVPWCALPGKEPRSYWGDEVALASAPSGPALLETLALGPVETPKSALLVGGIKFDKSSPLVDLLFGGAGRFNVLPATFQEVKDVAALLDDRKVDLQTGPLPDERRIRPLLPERRWLHFSTHGFFSLQVTNSAGGGLFANDAESRGARSSVAARHPLLFSGLVLANAGDVRLQIQENRPYDNLLTAEEISGMRLEGVEMVVLSACGTAQGVVEYGEGASSLARAFHLAGARTVVASRWPIYDASSAAFAKRYIANLKAGRPKAVALAEAQRWLRTNHRELSTLDHWAAFVVSGDWR